MSDRILIVGAGFAGAVYARELAEHGFDVNVIDKRPHIGGNAFDETLSNGTRIHRYGPHLFHTNNETVVAWLTRFGEFVEYRHRVQALLENGMTVPLPINRTTINEIFGEHLTDIEQVKSFLRSQSEHISAPANAAEYLNANIGRKLTDLFFRPYTKKMWGLDLESMSSEVVKRIPLRLDDEDLYFPGDKFQLLPVHGYTRIFEEILNHPRISTQTSVVFSKSMLGDFKHCFNSMPIDEYYDYELGRLPYRSIKFHHRDEPVGYALGKAPTINFTDDSRFTRQTDWSLLPGNEGTKSPTKTVTTEEPCDYLDNDFERYYPVKTSDSRYEAIYQMYKLRSGNEAGISFIGRCGTYQYLDMHQVISQSLHGVHSWISSQT